MLLIISYLETPNFLYYIAYEFNLILSQLTNLSFGILTQILYSSNYSSKIIWVWRGTNVAAIMITVAFGPMYWIITQRSFLKRELLDYEETFLQMDDDAIPENKNVTRLKKFFRFCGSYGIFLSLLIIQLVVVAGLTFLQNFTAIYKVFKISSSGGTSIVTNELILTPISIGISCIIGLMNYIWNQLCYSLTQFELHGTWSAFRSHNTFKLLFFKLISLLIMGLAKGFFAIPCILTVLGNQYIVQILLDVLVFNAIELFFPWLIFKLRRNKGNKSDEEMRPDFDVAEEYLELIYRQYTIYCGMAAIPILPLIATAATILELYLDKFRLLKICKKPPRTSSSIKSVVAFFLMFSSMLSVVNWGGGSVYSLIGYYWCNHLPSSPGCGQCHILQDVPGTGYVPNLLRNWRL